MGAHILIVTQLLVLLVYTQGSFGQLNSFSPQFALHSYTVTVQEGLSVDSLIVTLSASDSDSGAAGDVNYSVQDNPWFNIDNTGAVKVKSVIDAEDPTVKEKLSYIVTATDKGTPSLSGTTILSITIGDENEYRPEFVNDVYRTNIYDGDPPGTFVVQVQATDKDRDSVLIYDLPDIQDFPYFTIDANTGNVTINQTVDYDDISSSQPKRVFAVQARASDGRFLLFATIITTVNRKKPVTPKFQTTVNGVSVRAGNSSEFVQTTGTTSEDVAVPSVTVSQTTQRTTDIPSTTVIGSFPTVQRTVEIGSIIGGLVGGILLVIIIIMIILLWRRSRRQCKSQDLASTNSAQGTVLPNVDSTRNSTPNNLVQNYYTIKDESTSPA